MKKYISVLAIIFIISLAACSNQTISSTPTGNESNIQSNSITTLDKGIWPVNEYTEGLLFRPVRLHGQHLIQNMKIAVSTLPALATTTIASTWRF